MSCPNLGTQHCLSPTGGMDKIPTPHSYFLGYLCNPVRSFVILSSYWLVSLYHLLFSWNSDRGLTVFVLASSGNKATCSNLPSMDCEFRANMFLIPLSCPGWTFVHLTWANHSGCFVCYWASLTQAQLRGKSREFWTKSLLFTTSLAIIDQGYFLTMSWVFSLVSRAKARAGQKQERQWGFAPRSANHSSSDWSRLPSHIFSCFGFLAVTSNTEKTHFPYSENTALQCCPQFKMGMKCLALYKSLRKISLIFVKPFFFLK